MTNKLLKNMAMRELEEEFKKIQDHIIEYSAFGYGLNLRKEILNELDKRKAKKEVLE